MWVILGGLLSLCDNKCKTILKGAHQWRRVISQAGDHTRSPTVVSEIPVVLSQFTSNLPGNTETFPVLHLKTLLNKVWEHWGQCVRLLSRSLHYNQGSHSSVNATGRLYSKQQKYNSIVFFSEQILRLKQSICTQLLRCCPSACMEAHF